MWPESVQWLRRKASFCVSPFPFASLTLLNRPLHDNLIPDAHPLVHFAFSSLNRFLSETDGQTDGPCLHYNDDDDDDDDNDDDYYYLH